MTAKDALWYLIEGVLNKTYSIETFCSEFTDIYALETDYDELSSDEYCEFKELFAITGRFSSIKEEQEKYKYYTESDVMNKVNDVVHKLRP